MKKRRGAWKLELIERFNPAWRDPFEDLDREKTWVPAFAGKSGRRRGKDPSISELEKVRSTAGLAVALKTKHFLQASGDRRALVWGKLAERLRQTRLSTARN